MGIKMIDIRLKYQATIFVNAEDITPSPDIISPLIDIFRDKALIPGTFQQLGPAAPTLRLRFASSNDEWSISFATHRIDVDKNPTDTKGSNLGELTDFCMDATNFFKSILSKFNKRANRLGLNSNSLLGEMPESQLINAYSRLFIPPQFYKDTPPYEWNWRSVAEYRTKIFGLKDTLNVITKINRRAGDLTEKGQVTKFDRIQLALDINTTDNNKDYRFELPHIKDYLQEAGKLHNTLSTDMQEFISG